MSATPLIPIEASAGVARRKIEDHARIRRSKVKSHDVPPHGRVVRIDREGGFACVELVDEREVSFHRNSVVDGDFDGLQVGGEVRLAIDEKEGEQGLQATTVQLIDTDIPELELSPFLIGAVAFVNGAPFLIALAFAARPW